MRWTLGPALRLGVKLPLALVLAPAVPLMMILPRVDQWLLAAAGICALVLHHVVASTRVELTGRTLVVRPYGLVGRRREIKLSNVVAVDVVERPLIGRMGLLLQLGLGETVALGPWSIAKKPRAKLQAVRAVLNERRESLRGEDRY